MNRRRFLEADGEYLNLGCGKRTAPGWVNVDGSPSAWLAGHSWLRTMLLSLRVLPRQGAHLNWPANILFVDVSKPLPFRTGTFRGIYTSNMIRYLAPHELSGVLRECHRVLQTGGVFRGRESDLRKAAAAYLARAHDPSAAFDMAAMYELHREWAPGGSFLFELGAKFFTKRRMKCIYDVASFSELLRESGFTGIREADYLDSRLTNIAALESAHSFEMGFCLEATKPGEATLEA